MAPSYSAIHRRDIHYTRAIIGIVTSVLLLCSVIAIAIVLYIRTKNRGKREYEEQQRQLNQVNLVPVYYTVPIRETFAPSDGVKGQQPQAQQPLGGGQLVVSLPPAVGIAPPGGNSVTAMPSQAAAGASAGIVRYG